MTPADLDALVARINALADCSYWATAGWDIPGDATQVIGRLAVQAAAAITSLRNVVNTQANTIADMVIRADHSAAALVQLRDSEALARGKIAEQMIEIERLKMNQRCSAIEQEEVGYPCVFRAEAESRIAASGTEEKP